MRALGQSEGWTNPCGGTRWRTLPDGLIEVEGRGTPSYEPGDRSYDQMMQTWSNWGSLLSRAAADEGLPVEWLLAVATMETGLWADDPAEQAGIVSPAGAIGIMQLMPQTAAGFGSSAEAVTSPAENIRVGAALVASLDRRFGELPAIGASYNSGKLCDTDPCRKCNEWNLYADQDYPGRIIRWNNAALLYGLPSTFSAAGMAFGAGLAIAGILAARKMLRR